MMAVIVLLGAVALGAMALVSPESFDTPASAVGPMGGSVSDIDMERSGVASAGPIEVVGSTIAMGDVPLDVTVVPTWTLTNTGIEPIEIFQPHASVIEGCCPGPLQLGARMLAPGESTDLSFPLQMHPGMDGPHEFLVHVPLDPTGDQVLELGVTGDFHN
jgi:hypothetical protein